MTTFRGRRQAKNKRIRVKEDIARVPPTPLALKETLLHLLYKRSDSYHRFCTVAQYTRYAYTHSMSNKYYDEKKNDPEYLAERAAYSRKQRELKKATDPDYLKRTNAVAKAWRERNADKVRKLARERYAANREKYLEKAREYHAKNRQAILDKKREYGRLYMIEWRKKHPIERRFHSRAWQSKSRGSIDKTKIFNWESRICGVCNIFIEDKFHIDHIRPLSKGGLHVVENLQLTHPRCNLSKGSKYAE